ncbi:structural protein P5 [Parabacteroides goldsteinii]|uniref:structural protein P5 n=1 Tax=Parabacteroides goldsteinii TaxID=328812 RepID=UPI0022E4583F|nr:structural protein P5 [Parabacteroides goldsteinii]
MRRNELPRGLRNNNPGNIRRNSDVFQGEINPSRDKEFKQFKNMAYGYRAMYKILSNYYNKYRLNTIRKMISRWAPENENNTAAYVSLVSSYSGIGPDDLISFDREQMIRIVAGMSRVENGIETIMSDVIAGWNLL